MKKPGFINLPNILSAFRIILIPFFIYFYLNASDKNGSYIAAGILLLSGITDIADGYIARRFKMITELGRFLDPFADKLTQVAVCICIALNNPVLWIFFVIFTGKELLMAYAGFKLIKGGAKLVSSRWFGKAGTALFYIVMLLIVSIPDMPEYLTYTMIGLVAAFMIYAFIMYIPVYKELTRKKGRKGTIKHN